MCQYRMKKFGDAEEEFSSALSILKNPEVRGPSHPDTAEMQLKLADTYKSQGKNRDMSLAADEAKAKEEAAFELFDQAQRTLEKVVRSEILACMKG